MSATQAIAGPSSPRMTRSATGTRERRPLATLPLSHFAIAPSAFLAPPSPLSISHKRSAPGSGSPSLSRADGSDSRKVSRTEKSDGVRSGLGSGRRGDAEITPRVKERLERDELGLGRSPARRLFMGPSEGGTRSGITGTSLFPQSPTTSNPQDPSPFLAPSPPLSTRSSRSTTPALQPPTEPGENGVVRNIHDPGFPVHIDPLCLGLGVGIGTPDSRRNTSLPPIQATDNLYPASPSTSSATSRLDDQENIPPSLRSSLSTPSSAVSPKKRNTPSGSSHTSRSSATTASGSSAFEEEDTIQAGSREVVGARLAGRSVRSKLVQMMRMRAVSGEVEDADTEPEDASDGEGEGEELTPGKKEVDFRGKQRLVVEAEGL